MIVDLYHLQVTSAGGHRETYEVCVQSNTNPTLASVICAAWMTRNNRQRCLDPQHFQRLFSYRYSELADYESRQSIARQGFCIRLSEGFDTALHLKDHFQVIAAVAS